MVPMPTATVVPDDLISVTDAVKAAAAGERSVKEGDGLFTLKHSTSIGTCHASWRLYPLISHTDFVRIVLRLFAALQSLEVHGESASPSPRRFWRQART